MSQVITIEELSLNQKVALMAMESKAKTVSMTERYSEFKKMGLPAELITAFTELSFKTAKTVAGKALEIGKIIIDQVIEFIKRNPNMAIGVLVGAAVGSLTTFIPFIGPFIAPLTMFVGATLGGVSGHRVDKKRRGENLHEGLLGIADDVFTVAKEFFKLICDIFRLILDQKSI